MMSQEAGSNPPQETGLMTNSWYGKFHLEMRMHHQFHFELWGRGELARRADRFFDAVREPARDFTKRRQHYRGVRWPKMVAPPDHMTWAEFADPTDSSKPFWWYDGPSGCSWLGFGFDLVLRRLMRNVTNYTLRHAPFSLHVPSLATSSAWSSYVICDVMAELSHVFGGRGLQGRTVGPVAAAPAAELRRDGLPRRSQRRDAGEVQPDRSRHGRVHGGLCAPGAAHVGGVLLAGSADVHGRD